MRKVNLGSYNNDWFKEQIGASRFKQIFWYFVNVLIFKNGWLPFSSLKVIVLRLFGAVVGKNVVIKPSVNIKFPWKLVIDDHVWIGEEVWIDNLDNVHIHKNVCISQGALLLTGNHNYYRESFDLMIGKINIEEGAWLGSRSVVCPGVTVHSHAVLSVNSVATGDLEAYTIYQGNPAVSIKERIIAE